METLILSRIQFAANISFHILFPSITIALCWILFYFKLRYDFSKSPVWMRAYRFWVKVFALTFALGVVSGITMSFQFGTNWPGYMETVGNIAGPLLGYEVLTAFFMEATFLGIMLFGTQRVPNWLHTLSTFLVAVGTCLSAFWIIALNSWMHTPTGFEMRDGVAFPTDWFAIIFNPGMLPRLAHVLCASGLTASFLIAGLSAYRIINGDDKKAPRLALRTAVVLASVLAPLQLLLGDLQGLNTFKHQPQKVAAMEGLWETEQGADLLLFALPDEGARKNHLAFGLPNIASFILTHDMQGEIKGLNEFAPDHPPVAPVFFAFRLMVGLGMLMIAVAWFGCYQIIRYGKIGPLGLKIFSWMTFAGWIATLAGWYVTEIGRQPWLVSGVLKTADAVTGVPSGNVALSLTVYLTLYAFLIVAYLKTLFYMSRSAVEVEEYVIPNAIQQPSR